ncbi:MAG: single-stranded-DNA-specific exonuclease RecJ [Xanthomonadales bacterium]|nr:single-stranded-DNA-specific exonuclease RecJ [Xanthomonadales bacterium]
MIPGRVIRRRELPPAAEQLLEALPNGLHPVSRRVLLTRGVQDGSALSLALQGLLAPDSLGGIERAAGALADAVTEGQSVLVVGDFDADGATGTALAILALRAMGCARLDFRVPNRFEFGYGLTAPLVETLADAPPEVLITVDSGIACIEGVRRARELGCRVIVTDHHLPGERLPEAHAIVNPNCPGDAFPSKALAGVGVVFYLLGAVRAALRERGWFGRGRPEPNLAQFLDLVALGTVADLVPLDRNNRILVRQGLERIRRGQARPGLMALLRLGGRDYRFASAADLGFAVGPRLNAAGRLEDMAAGIRCLLSDDPDEAMRLAAQLDDLNRQRQSLQEQMQAEAMAQVRTLLARLESQPLPPALCLFDEAWHQGVVGLVASRVKDAVHRPVSAFAPESDGAALLKGSARSVHGLHIRDVLAWVDAHRPGLMRAFGGHAMAAGLSLERARLEPFRETLAEAVGAVLGDEELSNEVWTDGELAGDELGLPLAAELEALGPWGQRFPEPLFEGAFDVIDRRVVGGAHLKMVLRSRGGGTPLDAIAFNCLPEDLPGAGALRLLYRLAVNRWRGQESCQLVVEDILR